MRKFSTVALGLALAVLAPACLELAPAQAQQAGPQSILCNKTAVGSSGAATTLVITGNSPQNINICGYLASSGAAAGTFQLVSGTGATCTTPTTITGVVNLGINGNQDYSPGAAWYTVTPAGGNVCAVVTGTGPVSWTVSYSKF